MGAKSDKILKKLHTYVRHGLLEKISILFREISAVIIVWVSRRSNENPQASYKTMLKKTGESIREFLERSRCDYALILRRVGVDEY